MYPLAFLIIFIGFFSVMNSSIGSHVSIQTYSDEAIATNFCVYRKAVSQYIESTPGITSVPEAALTIPSGFINIGNWKTRINGGYCYIYGEATPDEIVLIRKKMGNSILIGRNENSKLYPSGIAVATSIPTGNVVSIVSLP